LLEDVSWQTYERLVNEVNNRNVRLTYDRGRLEIMSPSREHERYAHLLGRIVAILTEELDINMSGGGSMTFKRADVEKGLEPDDCYWIANEPLVREKMELDLTIVPPPDLAIEVDITRSHLNRHSVYAALGVPEIWCFDGQTILSYRLGESGECTVGSVSLTFPYLALEEVARFLLSDMAEGETRWAKRFRAWVSHEVAPKASGGENGGR
jgi:Uma2 family endonuclease